MHLDISAGTDRQQHHGQERMKIEESRHDLFLLVPQISLYTFEKANRVETVQINQLIVLC